jgi:hypothetical protein
MMMFDVKFLEFDSEPDAAKRSGKRCKSTR